MLFRYTIGWVLRHSFMKSFNGTGCTRPCYQHTCRLLTEMVPYRRDKVVYCVILLLKFMSLSSMTINWRWIRLRVWCCRGQRSCTCVHNTIEVDANIHACTYLAKLLEKNMDLSTTGIHVYTYNKMHLLFTYQLTYLLT